MNRRNLVPMPLSSVSVKYSMPDLTTREADGHQVSQFWMHIIKLLLTFCFSSNAHLGVGYQGKSILDAYNQVITYLLLQQRKNCMNRRDTIPMALLTAAMIHLLAWQIYSMQRMALTKMRLMLTTKMIVIVALVACASTQRV